MIFREKPSHSLVLIGNKVQDVSAPGGEVKIQKSKVKTIKSPPNE